MIQQDPVLCHPILGGEPPVVLQYAGNTLILLRSAPGAAKRLCLIRLILDNFVAASGLITNFEKSTLVPMHVDDDGVAEAALGLSCAVESFPRSYLGLPLS